MTSLSLASLLPLFLSRRSIARFVVGFFFLFTITCSGSDSSSETDRENTLLLTLLNLRSQEGFVTSSDKTPIYYRKVGSGTPVVVLHGGPGLDHNYLVGPLSQTIGAGKQLIFFDQRGTGFSGGAVTPTGLNADFINKNQFLEDLEAIRVQLGLGAKINIIGHSWGGLYAMLYATHNDYKDNVKSLALVGSAGAHHSYYGTFISNLVQRAGLANVGEIQTRATLLNPSNANFRPSVRAFRDYYEFTFKFYFADYDSTAGSSANANSLNFRSISDKTILNGLAIGSFIDASLVVDTAAYTNLQSPSSGNSTLNITEALRSINYPVLLVHGNNDLIPGNFILDKSDTASSLSVENNLKQNTSNAAKIKAVSIENAGHFPFIEQPTAFKTAFEGFYN